MKKLFFLLPLIIVFSNIFGQTVNIKKDTLNFYFEKSKKEWNKGNTIWTENGEFAILRVRYFRGDCCGGVPNAEQITAEIIRDTIFYNLNYKRIPNCRTNIGLCGNAIDIVVNTKKYPNYQKLILEEVSKNNHK